MECCAVGVIHWSLLSFFALLAAGWYLSGCKCMHLGSCPVATCWRWLSSRFVAVKKTRTLKGEELEGRLREVQLTVNIMEASRAAGGLGMAKVSMAKV